MNARDAMLGRIRAALRDAPTPPPVTRDHRAEPPPDLVSLFTERVEDYRATVARCTGGDVGVRVAALLDGRDALVPADLPWTVPGAVPDTGGSARELDAFAAVVTTAAVGVAVTGTLVLDHGPGQGRRALSLIPDVHVCVLPVDRIVHDVPDALARLDPRRPHTWISGPSATSDIELDRVEGVHGPRTLHVLLAG